VESLFLRALEGPPGERTAFLQALHEQDPSLEGEVRALLEAHDEPGLVDSLADRAAPPGLDVPANEPGTRFGPYQVDEVLGRGGMGVVYRAHRADGQFRQEVALKVLPADLLSRRHHDRFLAEREILARLSHANVARLLDGGVDQDGRPYFAMELVEGRTILEYCDDRRASVADRVELFITVCDAVQHAHQHLVVHRDLKPGNILVSEAGTPKLLDFGIGKILDAGGDFAAETQVGLRLLTPAYAAPEQLRGSPANTASDIYQLGILLFELLTGCHPFPERREPGSDPADWERSTLDPTRPSVAATADRDTTSARARARATTHESLGWALRGDLDAIILKALRPDPADRYRSATGLAEDLRRFLEHRPVRARRDSWGYRARLFVRRNRSGLAVTTAGLVGILAFTLGIARESRRTALERDRAEAVTDFMTELFANADPFRLNRSEIAVRDLLDDGLERLRADGATDARVRASMLSAIGRAYEGLGLSEPATEAFGEALALFRASDGVSAMALSGASARAGYLLSLQGRFDEARPLLAQGDSLLALAGEETETGSRAQVLSRLGTAWMHLGEPDRATGYLEEALAWYLADGDARDRAAEALGDLAIVRRDLGDPDSAEVLLRRGVGLREAAWGPGHLWVANSLTSLGAHYFDTGRLSEADSVWRRALEIRRTGLPEGHYLFGALWVGLGKIAAAQGEVDRADSLLARGLETLEVHFGPDHYSVGSALNDRAIFRQREGRTVEAEADFVRALDIYAAHFGPEHPYAANLAVNLAWVTAVNGKVPEALALYDEALPIVRDATPDEPSVYGSFTDYGIIRCLQGDAAAEPPLRSAVAELGRLAPGSDRELRARNALGSCLIGLGRNPEAAQILEKVLEDTESRPAVDPYRAFAEATLARLRLAEGGASPVR
jgi:serine/threonine-protein kinase